MKNLNESIPKEYKDVDYHLPYHLMLQIAKDTGFEINEKKRF